MSYQVEILRTPTGEWMTSAGDWLESCYDQTDDRPGNASNQSHQCFGLAEFYQYPHTDRWPQVMWPKHYSRECYVYAFMELHYVASMHNINECIIVLTCTVKLLYYGIHKWPVKNDPIQIVSFDPRIFVAGMGSHLILNCLMKAEYWRYL